ncbi:MAG: Stp1/IreP family PP2C-type Ser/Thr phosphatase [Acidobacteria bacterium]|nr:Stp1/IreP family PP2C-type Ser/Thr phosphatase [Acidobacteriota bacterium]
MSHRIESYGRTDIGRRRSINQDCVFFDDQAGLYIVADGMGGHSGGEVASRLAVGVVSAFVLKKRHTDQSSWPYGIDPGFSYNGNCLRTAIMLANAKVWEQGARDPDLAGMGTTIVVALAEEGSLTIASAGDSRAYRIREGAIDQITTDDSWVQDALDKGVLTREQLRNHAMKNVITRAVGSSEAIQPRMVEERLQDGDTYLFCSDGLHGMLQDSEILRITLAARGDLRGAVAELVAAANSSGGKDNISALMFRYQANI